MWLEALVLIKVWYPVIFQTQHPRPEMGNRGRICFPSSDGEKWRQDGVLLYVIDELVELASERLSCGRSVFSPPYKKLFNTTATHSTIPFPPSWGSSFYGIYTLQNFSLYDSGRFPTPLLCWLMPAVILQLSISVFEVELTQDFFLFFNLSRSRKWRPRKTYIMCLCHAGQERCS